MNYLTTITIGGFNPIAAGLGALGLLTVVAFVYFGLNDPTANTISQSPTPKKEEKKVKRGLFGR